MHTDFVQVCLICIATLVLSIIVSCDIYGIKVKLKDEVVGPPLVYINNVIYILKIYEKNVRLDITRILPYYKKNMILLFIIL